MAAKKKVQKKAKSNSFLKIVKHNYFLYALLGVLLICLIILGVISQQTTLTGHASIETVAFMKAGSELHSEINNVENVDELTLYFGEEDVKGLTVLTENIPAPNWEFNGVSFSSFRISSTDNQKIQKIDLLLKIEESKLNQADISFGDVQVFLNGKDLGAKLSKKESGYVYYVVSSFELGDFLIGKRVTESSSPTTSLSIEEEPQVQQPLATGQATAQKKGFFSKVGDFFKGLFS